MSGKKKRFNGRQVAIREDIKKKKGGNKLINSDLGICKTN